MVGSEGHFRTTFGQKRASVMLAALQRGSSEARRLATEQGFVEPRTEPSVAFDLSVKALSDFDQLDQVRRAYNLGQHLWVVDDVYALRVKKLSAGYQPANHQSGQQARIARFLPLNGMNPLIYLTAGTRYSLLTGLPVEWVVVKHQPGRIGGQAVEWVVDLVDLASGGMGSTTPTLDLPSHPAGPAMIRRRSTGSLHEAAN